VTLTLFAPGFTFAAYAMVSVCPFLVWFREIWATYVFVCESDTVTFVVIEPERTATTSRFPDALFASNAKVHELTVPQSLLAA
jgi:hypothetical protein